MCNKYPQDTHNLRGDRYEINLSLYEIKFKHIYMCVCVCMCVCPRICVYMYVCIKKVKGLKEGEFKQ